MRWTTDAATGGTSTRVLAACAGAAARASATSATEEAGMPSRLTDDAAGAIPGSGGDSSPGVLVAALDQQPAPPGPLQPEPTEQPLAVQHEHRVPALDGLGPRHPSALLVRPLVEDLG